MDNGYIKLFRKINQWEWYQDSITFHLFIHLLLSANHEGKKWQGIEILRGQCVTGLKALHQQTKISIQSLRTSLSKLKSTGELTIKSTNKYSIITICNYNSYQFKFHDTNNQINSQINKQLTNNQQATNKQLTTNNNDKNIKNDKKSMFVPPAIEEIKEYISKNNYNNVDANTFLKYFTESNWIDSKGNKVRNWKQKIITWSGRDNKILHQKNEFGY